MLCSFFRNLSKSIISPLSKSYEVSLKLTASVCLMSLAPKYFKILSKKELQTENYLFRFVVVGVVNTEIFSGFIKFAF